MVLLITLSTLAYTKTSAVVYTAPEVPLPHPEATAVAAASVAESADIAQLKSILTNLTALVGHLIDQQSHQSLTYTSNTRSSRDSGDGDFTVKQADRIYETIGDNIDDTTDTLNARIDALTTDSAADLSALATSFNTNILGVGTTTPTETLTVDGSLLTTGHVAMGNRAKVDGIFIDTFYPPSTSYHAILSIAEEVTSLPVGATNALGMNVALLANPASGTPLSSYRGAAVDVETDGGNNQNIGVLSGSYTQAAHVGSGNAAGLYAQQAFSYHAGSGTVTNQSGVWSELGVVGSGIVNNARLFEGSLFTSGGGGTINVATAFKGNIATYGSSDTINTARGVYVAIDNSAGGTITNAYGLYIDTIAGTNNWGLYQSNATNKNYFAGNVGIGTTTPSQKLSVVGNAQFTGVTSGAYAADLNLTADGTLTTASSDRRLKDNETLLDTKDTLAKLLTLAPKSFTWKETGTTDIGFIAQDVELIFPELVFTNPNDGYMGINYSRLPALIVAAIQEMWMTLIERLDRQDERFEKLERENELLKARLGEIESALDIENQPPEEEVVEDDPAAEGGGEELPLETVVEEVPAPPVEETTPSPEVPEETPAL